ncbi:MAG: hypothetical protein HYR85_06920 [Planctomycetes bacterium]|nr:hypothetical protein [Planctomycetota bacterium]MBI3843919.1 hypothetical protein [Planctomycetota bacterium]
MQLEIARTPDPTRYTWTITYDGNAGRQVRPYELVVRDAAHGVFATDEKNGVVLEARLIGGALYTEFDVGDARLLLREMLQGHGTLDESISFEFVVASRRAVDPSGDPAMVTSVPPNTVQRATLRRVR